jgi:ribonuclease-3
MTNYKGELLERMQGSGRGVPKYEVIEEIGPDHIKVFVISVSINGMRMGTGQGTSKKEAEQRAAKMALEELNRREEQTS